MLAQGTGSSQCSLEEGETTEVRVWLIDFGRSLSAWRHHAPAAPAATATAPSATPSATFSAMSSASAEASTQSSLQQSQEEASEQYTELCKLYDVGAAESGSGKAGVADSRGSNREEVEEVRYRGDVSCKAYKCPEMADGLPWSYQVLFSIVTATVVHVQSRV